MSIKNGDDTKFGESQFKISEVVDNFSLDYNNSAESDDGELNGFLDEINKLVTETAQFASSSSYNNKNTIKTVDKSVFVPYIPEIENKKNEEIQTDYIKMEQKGIQCTDFVYISQNEVNMIKKCYLDEISALKKTNEELHIETKKEINLITSEKEEMLKQIKSLNETKFLIETEKEKVLQENKELKTKNEKLIIEKDKIEKEVISYKEELSNKVSLIKTNIELSEKISQLETINIRSKDTISNLKSRLKEGGILNSTLLNDRDKLKEIITKNQKELVNANSEIKLLKKEILTSNTEMKKMAEAVIKAESQYSQIQHELSETKNQLEREKENQKTEIAELKKKIIEMQKSSIIEMEEFKQKIKEQTFSNTTLQEKSSIQGNRDKEKDSDILEKEIINYVPIINITKNEGTTQESNTNQNEIYTKKQKLSTNASIESTKIDEINNTDSLRNAFTQTPNIVKKNKGVGVDFYKALAYSLNQEALQSNFENKELNFLNFSLDEMTENQKDILRNAFPLNTKIGNNYEQDTTNLYLSSLQDSQNSNNQQKVYTSSLLVECVSCLALRGEISKLNAIINSLEEDITKYKEDLEDEKNHVKSYKHKLSTTLETVNEAEKALKKITDEKEELETRYNSCQKLLIDKTEDIIKKTKIIEMLTIATNELKQKLSEFMEEYKKLEEEKKQAIENNKTLNEDNTALKLKIDKIKGELNFN